MKLWRRGWDSDSVVPFILRKLLILHEATIARTATVAQVGYSFGTLAASTVLLLFAGVASAQQQTAANSNPISANISASAANCATTLACVWMKLPANAGTISVAITGTFSQTLIAEQSADGGNTWTTVATLSSADQNRHEIDGDDDLKAPRKRLGLDRAA